MKSAIGTTALSLALGMLLSVPALAEDELHSLSASPVDRCQGALPSFEGAIRKRPLAVQNEGSSNAFVTCAFATEAEQASGSRELTVYFFNNNAAATAVTCTAVTGYQGSTNEFVSMTTDPIIPGEQESLRWENGDFAAGLDFLIAISCSLPPGIGINDSYIEWVENDNEGA